MTTTQLYRNLEQTLLIAKAQGKSIDLGFFPALKSATSTVAGTKSTAYAVTATQKLATALEDSTVERNCSILLLTFR